MKKSLLVLLFISTVCFAQTPCSGGFANGYPCDGITLQDYISSAAMGAVEAQDSWGWTDPSTNKEYAIVALDNGTAFVDISNPTDIKYLGRMDSYTGSSYWRDVKIYNNHAYIVSDSNGSHGVQIFDLTRLRGLTGSPALNFNKNGDGRYSGVGSAHNIIINEETGYAYVLGSNRNGGGPRILDLSDPKNPTLAGDISAYGYCHDAQVVVYDGPDPDYQGKEILIGSFSNSDYVQILDVTNKSNVTRISFIDYINKEYTHQGWFTEDKRFFIAGDELDEGTHGFNTKTIVFDLTDLDNPLKHYVHYGETSATDHNGYVRGNRFYLANYAAGMRVFKVDGLYDETNPTMDEINYFDMYTPDNSANFHGTWNVYPFFESGNIIATGFGNLSTNGDGGLFILKDPNYDNTPPTASCQNFTATLDRVTGTVTITADDIDNGSTDNFGIVKKSLEASKTTFTCADVGKTFEVTLTVEDDYANKSSCTATVTVEAETTSYNGATWSNGVPSLGSNAKISANYNTATNSSFETCTCEVDASRTLTVAAGDYINVQRDITVNGNLYIAHEGSVVQQDNDATTINNGTISVEKITPNLDERDFMILGSPVSGETRNGVYGTSVMVRNHITANFTPNQQVNDEFPLAENFADDNGDNWVNYTGTINPGEGYLVRPQTTPTETGSFTLDYTQGTLNNGVVTFDLLFNTEANDSPNMLSNPYPSAIDADAFLDANPTIETLYFWEHLTAPNPSYPGYNPNNYNMNDISMYNEMGGSEAGNDPGTSTRPNGFIASGQGFGVKTSAAATAVFNNSMRVNENNDTYRRTAFESDRIWLQVRNEKWDMGSSILVGFSEVSTDAFESKYDSKRLATPVSLYSEIASGEQLAIQGRAPLADETEVLLGFDTQINEETTYHISISDIQGPIIENATVYLIDNKSSTVTNLSEEDYEFTAEKGNFNSRFILQFKSNQELDTSESLSQIAIFPNPANQLLNITSPSTYLKNIAVYDLLGRRINEKVGPNNNTHQLSLKTLNTGIYFVKIDTELGTVTKKLIKE